MIIVQHLLLGCCCSYLACKHSTVPSSRRACCNPNNPSHKLPRECLTPPTGSWQSAAWLLPPPALGRRLGTSHTSIHAADAAHSPTREAGTAPPVEPIRAVEGVGGKGGVVDVSLGGWVPSPAAAVAGDASAAVPPPSPLLAMASITLGRVRLMLSHCGSTSACLRRSEFARDDLCFQREDMLQQRWSEMSR